MATKKKIYKKFRKMKVKREKTEKNWKHFCKRLSREKNNEKVLRNNKFEKCGNTTLKLIWD